MESIIIEVTAEQRRIIMEALAYLADEARRNKRYDYDEIEAVRTLVSRTKCGDRYCKYCGDLKYDYMENE